MVMFCYSLFIRMNNNDYYDPDLTEQDILEGSNCRAVADFKKKSSAITWPDIIPGCGMSIINDTHPRYKIVMLRDRPSILLLRKNGTYFCYENMPQALASRDSIEKILEVYRLCIAPDKKLSQLEQSIQKKLEDTGKLLFTKELAWSRRRKIAARKFRKFYDKDAEPKLDKADQPIIELWDNSVPMAMLSKEEEKRLTELQIKRRQAITREEWLARRAKAAREKRAEARAERGANMETDEQRQKRLKWNEYCRMKNNNPERRKAKTNYQRAYRLKLREKKI